MQSFETKETSYKPWGFTEVLDHCRQIIEKKLPSRETTITRNRTPLPLPLFIARSLRQLSLSHYQALPEE